MRTKLLTALQILVIALLCFNIYKLYHVNKELDAYSDLQKKYLRSITAEIAVKKQLIECWKANP